MEKIKRFLCLTLVLALLASFAVPEASAAATVTAVTMQLTKTEGTVEISKSNGKTLSLREGMRLYNGYNITTSEESYAWINLDSAKLTKVDALSSVEVRKSGSQLELNISSGSVFFEVSEPLDEDESLNISTSTMTVGIRGTSGWVRITDQWVSQICILEGTVQCVVSDPVTGQLKSAVLTGGDMAQCVVYHQDQPGDKCDILMDRATTWDIPGFILADLVYNVDLCDKILEETGLDVLADLATVAGGAPSGRVPDGGSASPEVLGLARDRLEEEEAETGRRQEEIREKEALQENNISRDPVWGETPQPTVPPTPAATSVPTATPAPSEPGGGPSGDDAPEETPAPEGTTYTLTLAYNGIPVSFAADSVVTGTDGKAQLPDVSYTPNTDGTLAFKGWFTAPSGGTQVTNATVFTSDQTIYAQWEGWDWEITTRTRAVYPTLRIFGWGPMKDYAENAEAPWSAEEIGLLVVEHEIEYIGVYAFARLEALEIVEIADSVTRIGPHAFCQCTGLTSVDIPGAVESIPSDVFEGCDGLKDIYYGGTKTKWNRYEYKEPESVTVHFTGDSYTVTYDSQGGSAVPSETVEPRDRITRPAGPARTGYTFGGWYREAACETAWDFAADTVTGNMTLYAKWTPNTYTVTFDSQGAAAVTPQDIDYSEKITKPADPDRTGYTFGGWYREAACETAWDFDNNSVTGDLILYAKWTLNTYTVTFDLNGGPSTLTAPDPAITDAEGKAVLAAISYTPNTDGTLAFKGWFTAPSGGDEVTDNTVFASDQTVYAQWEGWDWELNTETKTLRLFGTGRMKDYETQLMDGYRVSTAPWGISDPDIGGIGKIEHAVIEDGIQNLGNYAFYKSSIKDITIPGSVNSIGISVFVECTGLTSVTIPQTVTAIGDYAFYDCSGLTSFVIPSGVTSIGASVFYGCTSLTDVTLPDNITAIGDYAFRGCTGLTSIAIPQKVTAIGDHAFSGCSGLTSFVIPSGVTSIGTAVFYDCTSLTDVTLPDNMTAIGDSAFQGCTGLTSIAIPQTVTAIGSSAFRSCTGLTDIYFGGTREAWDAANPDNQAKVPDDCTVHCSDDIEWTFDADTGTLRIYGMGPMEDYYDATTHDTVGNLPPWEEHGEEIRKIVIEEGITRIGNQAFYAMNEPWGYFFTCPNLTEVSIPASVTSIGESAFQECTSLESITIPAEVTSIGEYAFYGCTSLKDIYFTGTREQWEIANWNNPVRVPDGCTVHYVEWAFEEDTHTLRIYGTGRMEDYTCEYIPSGNPPPWSRVSYDCDIQNVVIEEGITRIGNRAFYTDGELRGEYTCPNLAAVSIPNSVTSIGEYAFCKTGLVSIDIPGSVTSIGECAFYKCTSLTSVIIPESVTSIGACAFDDCTSLITVNYGGTKADWEGVTKGSNTFPSQITTIACADGPVNIS